MGLDKVALEHILVPGVWLFDSFECAKPAGFWSRYRSDQEWSFPFAMHFPLLLTLRDASKDEIALLDFSRSHFFVAPPSGFLLVFAEVNCRLGFDSFNYVNCWLDVFVGFFCPIRPVAKFFWSHGLFAIEELEGCEFCGPRLRCVVRPDYFRQLIYPLALRLLCDVLFDPYEDDPICPFNCLV